MFSGLVKSIGAVWSVDSRPDGSRLEISVAGVERCSPGDSLAVSGVCLTVVSCAEEKAGFDVSSETLRRTTLGRLGVGDRVNLERPLTLSDLLHGHIVQGHVDCIATVSDIRVEGDTRRISFTLPPSPEPSSTQAGPSELARYFVPKGSVTVDGVSLTVGEVSAGGFSTYVIPATWRQTIIASYELGTEVNIEIDIIAKYLERLSRR